MRGYLRWLTVSLCVLLSCGGSTDGNSASSKGDGRNLGDVDGAFGDGDQADDANAHRDAVPPVEGGLGDVSPNAHISFIVLPDDGRASILNAIKGATKSIHLEMYLLTDHYAIESLIAARAAGRDVSVILEQAPYPNVTANQAAYDALKGGGVAVVWSRGPYALTHSKFFVIDSSTAYVMTLNFTASGLSYNREYAAINSDPVDVAAAETLFAADLSGAVTKVVGS
ncbi:MAG: hypothetical protein NVSMB1_06830 [Polyangiales bacterium]